MNVQDRINQFAKWFDVEPLQLQTDPDDPTPEDGIIDWCMETGASIDWIVCGDPKPAVASYRKENLQRERFRENLKELNDAEVTAMHFVMQGVLDGEFPMKQAMQVWHDECAKRRRAA